MANRETYPASQSPLTGDISGPAGAQIVTVTGLQRNPVSPANPTDQDKLTFQAANGDWEPTADGNVAVTIGTQTTAGGVITGKGVALSDDRSFSVNNIGIDGLVGWTLGFAFDIFVNGTGVL